MAAMHTSGAAKLCSLRAQLTGGDKFDANLLFREIGAAADQTGRLIVSRRNAPLRLK